MCKICYSFCYIMFSVNGFIFVYMEVTGKRQQQHILSKGVLTTANAIYLPGCRRWWRGRGRSPARSPSDGPQSCQCWPKRPRKKNIIIDRERERTKVGTERVKVLENKTAQKFNFTSDIRYHSSIL